MQTTLFTKNTQGYDLHTHSTASDGSLQPHELVDAAIRSGVENLALSDHDTIDGYHLAKQHIDGNSLTLNLIPSVEFSSRWNIETPDAGKGRTVHIVALHVDPKHAALKELISLTQDAREERNKKLKVKMHKKGWEDVFDLAEKLTGQGQLTRTHLARAMLEKEKIANYRHAFSRYLGDGKPLAVHTKWPNLTETISRIKLAGGTAVLAHPLHYQLTRKKLLQLCSDFKSAGGEAIEVITGRATKASIEDLTGIALRLDLMASVGSDFHAPVKGNIYLGVQPSLPETLTPVWKNWNK